MSTVPSVVFQFIDTAPTSFFAAPRWHLRTRAPSFIDEHFSAVNLADPDHDEAETDDDYDDLPELIPIHSTRTTAAVQPVREDSLTRRMRAMAIEHIAYPDAANLVAKEKTFYPVRIPVSHWQLRHYISNPEPDHLYYASGKELYCLHTSSRKRKHVATLPFEARCTASGFGWVCLGGEHEGHFAAVKIERGDGRSSSIKVDRIGEDIVNSISIHRIQDEEAHLDDIVAILTNNDKTVRIFSLPQGVETCVLDLPFAMNHATVSPDGCTLVAVGDVNQAYFFRRELRDTPPQIPKPHNRLNSGSVDWRLTHVVSLHVTSPEASQGYFTTAWSPNGRMVALGSEGGYITVLDTELLEDLEVDDQDAIIAIVPSSRPDVPQPHPGAVRSMIFAPDPWDLLIWAEDQGRICVGDLRTRLRQKQVIELNPKEEDLHRIELEDPGRTVEQLEREFMQRYSHAQDNATAVNFATEYIEARRRQRQHRQDMALVRGQSGRDLASEDARGVHIDTQDVATASTLGGIARGMNLDDDPRGLTATEQEILNTLRTTRQREEARSHGASAAGVNYTTPDMFSTGTTRTSPSVTLPGSRPIRDLLTSMPDMPTDQTRPTTSSGLEASIWATNADSTSIRDPSSRIPRRRASIILTPPATASTTTPQQSHPSIWTPHTPPHENPWRTITNAMTSSTVATGANTTALPRLTTGDGYETVLRRIRGSGITGREIGVRTAGLAISEDGGTLWAACEEGIFEMKVGRKGRMFWPAVEPR